MYSQYRTPTCAYLQVPTVPVTRRSPGRGKQAGAAKKVAERMAKKPVKRGSADNFFVSNVEEPFESFIGKYFTLLGNLWPNCVQKDRFT